MLAAQTPFMSLIQHQPITASTTAAAVIMEETAGRQAAAAAEFIKLEPGRRLVHILPARDRAFFYVLSRPGHDRRADRHGRSDRLVRSGPGAQNR